MGQVKPFYVKDCALSAVATGMRCQVLSDFRDSLAKVHPSSIYYHFWIGRLRPEYAVDAFHNDFARWVHHHLHDPVLAERLNIIDPTEYDTIEELRDDLVDLADTRLAEREFVPSAAREEIFHFVRAIFVIFDTPLAITEPDKLSEVIENLSDTSLFYHFIDARRRTPDGYDDFTQWLSGFDHEYAETIKELRAVNPFFMSLDELRDKITQICRKKEAIK